MKFSSPFLRDICFKHKKNCASEFPYSLPLFQNDFSISFINPISIICGENGSGKSTLLRSIAIRCGFNAMGGNRNISFQKEREILYNFSDNMIMSWKPKVSHGFFFRADGFLSFASFTDDRFKQGDFLAYESLGGRSLSEQSHGQGVFSLIKSQVNVKNNSIIILDEPEAALSPKKQYELIQVINESNSDGKLQFIIATHSPIIMSLMEYDIIYIEEKNISNKTMYETPHYEIYSHFFLNTRN